ncbi:MAG: hypothetical protein DWQ45_23465 [Planctomycetota bacterium]|nr:MAG: hypothetical protein DWQ45_23465 [Planctomycetota bacterium]
MEQTIRSAAEHADRSSRNRASCQFRIEQPLAVHELDVRARCSADAVGRTPEPVRCTQPGWGPPRGTGPRGFSNRTQIFADLADRHGLCGEFLQKAAATSAH